MTSILSYAQRRPPILYHSALGFHKLTHPGSGVSLPLAEGDDPARMVRAVAKDFRRWAKSNGIGWAASYRVEANTLRITRRNWKPTPKGDPRCSYGVGYRCYG